MTGSPQEGAGLERRTAQELVGLHGLLAGALQFEDAQCTVSAGDGELVVEQRARRTGAIRARGAQDLHAYRLAVDRDLEPGARKRRKAADVIVHLLGRF